MKSKNNLDTATTVVPFTIEWPKELDIKPLFTVAVSKNFEAAVYAAPHPNYYEGKRMADLDQYCVTIQHKETGLPPKNNNFYYNSRSGDGHTVATLLQVRFFIEAVSRALRPIKKKTVEIVERDDDE